EPAQRAAPQRRSAPGVSRPTRTLEGELGKIEELEVTVARQQKQIETVTGQLRQQGETFTARLEEQAAQIQKVSAQLETSKRPLQVVDSR
ncbi:MAG TPA: hypothetical protein VGK91_08645, partial [Candidatus Udaeobacter sp.]